MRRLAGSIFFCFLISLAGAQNRLADSLQKVLEHSKSDSTRSYHYTKLVYAWYNQAQYEKALAVSLEQVAYDEKISFKRGLAESVHMTGNIYYVLGNYPSALQFYFRALKLQEELGSKSGVAHSLGNIGVIYHLQGDYDKALDYYRKAMNMHAEAGQQKDLADDYNNIGNIYLNKADHTQALDYYFKSLAIRKEVKDLEGEATSLNNIGSIYKEQGKYDLAKNYLEGSLKLSQQLEDPVGEAIAYVNLGGLYLLKKDYEQAGPLLQKSLDLGKEVGDLETEKEANQLLSEYFEARGNDLQALTHFKAYIANRDSLQNEENTKKTVRMEMNYEFDKKEEAARLEQEKKEVLAAADKKRQNIILMAISGIGLLVLGFAIFAYRSFLQKQKANVEITRQKHLIEEKQKEILDSIYYARRIQRSLLTSERYIRRNLGRMIRD